MLVPVFENAREFLSQLMNKCSYLVVSETERFRKRYVELLLFRKRFTNNWRIFLSEMIYAVDSDGTNFLHYIRK